VNEKFPLTDEMRLEQIRRREPSSPNGNILMDLLTSMELRITELENAATRPGRKRGDLDEIGQKIVAHIDQFPGMPFTGLTLSYALNLSTGMLAGRLARMAERGHIKMVKPEGKNPLYFSVRDDAQPPSTADHVSDQPPVQHPGGEKINIRLAN
jgi:hypothetical protein